MAITSITIELIGDTKVKFTVQGKVFEDVYGEPLRKRVASAAIDQAHFDEAFSITVISKGNSAREQSELSAFKEILAQKIKDVSSEELNLMIEGQPNNSKLPNAKSSKEKQLNILREAKMAADNLAASGKISQADLKSTAEKNNAAELLKANAFFMEKPHKQEASDAFGIGIACIIVGVPALIAVLAVAAPVAVIAVPAVVLLLGVFALLIGFGQARDFEKNNPSQLIKKLKRVDPDFLASLKSEVVTQPGATAEHNAKVLVSAPTSSPELPSSSVGASTQAAKLDKNLNKPKDTKPSK